VKKVDIAKKRENKEALVIGLIFVFIVVVGGFLYYGKEFPSQLIHFLAYVFSPFLGDALPKL